MGRCLGTSTQDSKFSALSGGGHCCCTVPVTVVLPGSGSQGQGRGGTTPASLFCELVLFPHNMRCGNVVAWKEAGKRKASTDIVLFVLILRELILPRPGVLLSVNSSFFPAQRQQSPGASSGTILCGGSVAGRTGTGLCRAGASRSQRARISSAPRSFFINVTGCSHVLLFSIGILPWPLSLLSSQEVIPDSRQPVCLCPYSHTPCLSLQGLVNVSV